MYQIIVNIVKNVTDVAKILTIIVNESIIA